jgi:hypothetical protein
VHIAAAVVLCMLQVPGAEIHCDTSSVPAALSVVRMPQHITQAHPLFAGFPGSASALSAGKHKRSKGSAGDKGLLVRTQRGSTCDQCLQDMLG